MKENNLKFVFKSLDFKHYLKNLLLFVFVCLLFMVMGKTKEEGTNYWVYILGIVLVYYAIRIGVLFIRYRNCELVEVTFENIHFIGRYAYYEIHIEEDGRNVKKVTRTIFYGGLLSGKGTIEKYNNKKVLIGYNKKDKLVLTIKLCDNVQESQ